MPTLRIAEWNRKRVEWPRDVRESFSELALGWKNAGRLNAAPLEWGGTDGQILSVRQWVGVLESGEYRIEIYPKLDAHLLHEGDNISDQTTLLQSLLSMIAAADYGDWIESGRASLQFEPLQFADVWAYLLGRNLAPLLRQGVSHAYLTMHDDLPAVRGKIAVSRQVTLHFNRADKIACIWDEWSADNALNRLLKCALDFLWKRARHSQSRAVLSECLSLLDSAQSVSPREALAQTERFSFSRATLRFQNAFDLSRRLLSSQSPDFGASGVQNWVFLTDMNALFESFCAAALRESGVQNLETQFEIGTLFRAPNRIRQLPDFLWREGENWQLGDAKWKLLGQNAPDFAEENEEIKAGKAKISPDDARQMSVYSEIWKRENGLVSAPPVTIFYPLLEGNRAVIRRTMWNGAELRLRPVRVKDFGDLDTVLG
ncbi:5-methylcytosine-specific restriction endonuclease McrBC, regulatory subunit McrC [Abditibacterium utsteinense]|uniref:5-methylcytosine-specific restriction endonuclease McrBC, regulatory subunit McrC n=1 Tax=Abditibacterium utsteinense TaxID=1960156 RepID=A0A2S8SNV4_9BACT|nr:hypothetical protein [Abditibacterium utsteinense]PQV62468.1 5-methylcytosine-specific restriction endonuclease McrBC, regulatory subunit McrC [Abditibacterium utsteinense]